MGGARGEKPAPRFSFGDPEFLMLSGTSNPVGPASYFVSRTQPSLTPEAHAQAFFRRAFLVLHGDGADEGLGSTACSSFNVVR
jgi:hypothetical protein